MIPPHEVVVLTVEDVLLDIYDGHVSGVDTETATKAFSDWMESHDACYFANVSNLPGSEAIVHAVLESIRRGKRIVVIASTPIQSEDSDDDFSV